MTTFSRVKFGVAVVSSFVCVVVPDVDPRFAMNFNAHVAIQYLVSDVSTLFYMETRAPVPIKWRRIRPSGRTVLDSIRSNLLGQLHDGVRPSTVCPVAIKLNRRET